MLFSRWLARTTKRTLCSPTSTVPHAILPSHEGPSPPPSPRRSVKDVLTTPRKGCHEIEHRSGLCHRFGKYPHPPVFVSADSKEVTGEFFVSADSKGVISPLFPADPRGACKCGL